MGELNESSDIKFTVFKKDARTIQLIKDAIKKNNFLCDIDESQINDLIAVMYPKEVKANTRLIREGETGSHLYVSEEGNFEIYVGDTYYGSFGPGVAFGELALLYNTQRLCSIDVQTKAKLWVLDRKVFKSVMEKTEKELLEHNLKVLRGISILKSFPEEVLVKISDLIAVEFYQANSHIIRQGDPGEKFYIVHGGNVKITKNVGQGREKEVAVLEKGDYFGEKALYDEGEYREANAIALPPGVECYTIKRKDFLQYLGGFDTIRNTNWNAFVSAPMPDNWEEKFQSLTLSDFEVEGTLGTGGYGRVELVVIKSMPNISFARKKIKKHLVTQDALQKMVYNEKNNLKICDSPFICKLHRTFKDSRYLYLLMEACLGGDVRTALQRKGRFDVLAVRFIAACIVEAFDYIHSRGIVYRDLKPENMLIDQRGYVKLADFGSTKKIGPYKTKTFIGTPEYLAPEIIQSRSYSKAVDYWALGIVIYELFMSRTPFEVPDEMEMYSKILRGFNDVMTLGIIKGAMKDIIQSFLQEDPTKRLGHMRNGVRDIRSHKWFNNFNWTDLKNLSMPSPIVPTVRDHLDQRNFERYLPDRNAAPNDYSDWDANF